MSNELQEGTRAIEQVTLEIPLEEQNVPASHNGGEKYKNIEMEQMLSSLEKHLDRIDKIGYAAARNTRILRNETQEYFRRREELINKYGTPETDKEGNATGRIELRFDSPEFEKYSEEIEEWALIEHQPNLFKLKYEEAIGHISGADLLEIEWMFED